MTILHVSGMGCGRCEAAITRAIQAADPDAVVHVERSAGRVIVTSSLPDATLSKLVTEAGYPATPGG